MILILYFICLSSNVGLFNLQPLFSLSTPIGSIKAGDTATIALLLLTLPGYLRQRSQISSVLYKSLELIWLLFTVYYLMIAWFSPSENLTGKFVNIRPVEHFIFFFTTVAVINTRERITITVIFGILISIGGTIMTIAQSLYGLENITDSPFYDVGFWGGNKQYVGDLARVNLPISNWISFVFLVLLIFIIFKFKVWYLPLAGFLSIAIIINFARSLWLSLLLGFVFAIIMFQFLKLINTKLTLRLILIPSLVYVGLSLAPVFGLPNLTDALFGRINEGIDNVISTSGTFESRMDYSSQAVQLWWENNPLFGLGFSETTSFAVDVAYSRILLTMGLVGLLLDIALLSISLFFGIASARRGAITHNQFLIIAGVSGSALVVLIFVYQAWLVVYALSILGFASGITEAINIISTRPLETNSFQKYSTKYTGAELRSRLS
jgi:hypothetical protein